MLVDICTVISNLAFLIPMAEAIERQFFFQAIIYLFIVVSSSLYHSCNSFGSGCMGLPPTVLRSMDFFFAQFTIPLIALYAIKMWDDTLYALKLVALLITGFVLFIVQRYWGDSLVIQMLVAGVSFGAIFVYWFLYALRQCRKYEAREAKGEAITHKHILPPYRWEYFALGIGLSGVAVSLFAAEMLNHLSYWAIHSVWHVDAALAQYMMLNIWEPKARPVYLHDPKKPDGRGHRVAITQRHTALPPHYYAIPSSTTTLPVEPSSTTTTLDLHRRVHHVAPPSRVIVVNKE